jgi:D-alanyl-D-alanine dipeptidase
MQELRAAAGILVFLGIIGCQPHIPATASSPVPAPEGRTAIRANPTNSALQMIVVITDDWSSVPGVMRLYERDGVRTPWRPAGEQIPVVVGESGLGWGDGLHGIGSPGEPGPVKHEGDGRSPAGAFRLTSAFGYAPRDSLSWIRMPYTQATDAYKCVDDSASVHYNQMLLSNHATPLDWHSAEDMHRPDSLYRLGVVVAHNPNGRDVGAGSCIFLHIWPGPAGSTVGCTAFSSDAMARVLAWLDPEALPILVQLPRSEYDRLRMAWALPPRS